MLKLTEEMMIKHVSNWEVSASLQRKLMVKSADTVVTNSLGKTSNIKSDRDLRKLWNNILDRQRVKLKVMQAVASFSKDSQKFGLKSS